MSFASLTRRPLLALLLTAPVLFAMPAQAADAPYLTAKELDLTRFLPPAVAAGSVEDKADVAAAAAIQKAASPERIALAQHDADETVWVIFGSTLGEKFAAPSLPLVDRLFARVGDSEDGVVDPAKPFFGRVRPYLAAPDEIKPLVKASKSGSYPSGHTTRATMEGIILVSMLPEKRAEIWARVAEYAESRVVGGMHYPRDLEAGRLAGTAMAATLFADPKFVADFEAAKAELRKVYGL